MIVSGVGQLLDKSLWKPERFLEDFGKEKAEIINCITGTGIVQPMEIFWKGFEDLAERLPDGMGRSTVFKLKVTSTELFATFLEIGENLEKSGN